MEQAQEHQGEAHRWQERVLKQIKWSSESCTLDKLMDSLDWPKMIQPETGWYGNAESVTFCGDQPFVGLGVRNFKRVMACDYHDFFDTSMVKLKEKAKPQYLIPLTTMCDDKQENRVKILPIRGTDFVYPRMSDLWDFTPRYAKPLKTISTAGDTRIKEGYTFELKYQENDCVICDIKSQHRTVAIPLTAKGNFIIIQDDNTYSLQEVYENFTLPQRVSFLEKPPGLTSSDVLLITDARYDVLIACTLSSLYSMGTDTEIKNESMMMTKSSGLTQGDVSDANFVYFPKPINEESATSALEFRTWLYTPMCDVIKSTASLFEMKRFKDINVVIDANSTSVSQIQECSAENIYDYITVRDFSGVFRKPPVPQSPTRSTPDATGKIDTEDRKKWKADDQRQKGPTSKKVTPAHAIANRRKSEPDTGKGGRSDMSDRPLPPLPQDPYDDVLLPPSVSGSTTGTKTGHQQTPGEQAGGRPSDPRYNRRDSEVSAQLGPKSAPLKDDNPNTKRPPSSPATVPSPIQKEFACPTPGPNPQLQSGKMIKFPPPDGELTPLSQLTIDQLALLFTYFNLDGIAEKMKEYKVTGKFFEERLDAKDFSAEPFHATVFQQKQIERIKDGDY